jgi:HEAT repeat protein
MLAMDDPETFVQDEAHKSLKKLARVEALPYLQAARESGTPRVRLALADIVSGLRGPEATTLLAELLGDADERVRQSAETTLEGLDAQTATALLLSGLGHPSFRVKMRCATLLGRRKEVKAVDRLAELALAPLEATEVREASRAALRHLRDALDLPGLVASARDGSLDQKARARALILLAAKGGPDALQTCLDLLADPDESMRASAAQALAYLGDPRALAVLRAAQSRGENSGIAKIIGGSIQKIERGALAASQ